MFVRSDRARESWAGWMVPVRGHHHRAGPTRLSHFRLITAGRLTWWCSAISSAGQSTSAISSASFSSSSAGGMSLRSGLPLAHQVHLRELADLFMELQDLPVARALDPERRRIAPGHALD